MRKPVSYALLAFLTCLLPVMADDAPPMRLTVIGEMPSEKSPDLLFPKERNPFIRREAKIIKTNDDRESEESKLRLVLSKMAVTGAIRGEGTPKVLLDSMILKQGEPIPPLIEGQTEKLVVSQITESQVEIDFVENDQQTTARKILIPIDLHPKVDAYLPTQDNESKPGMQVMKALPVEPKAPSIYTQEQ